MRNKRETRLFVIANTKEMIDCYRETQSTVIVAKRFGVHHATAWRLMRKHSEIVPLKNRNLDERNPLWKGDKVQYHQLHTWVRKRKPWTGICEMCKESKKLDLANISDTYNKSNYTRDFDNWRWLCRRCHITSDGRMDRLNAPKQQA